MTRDDRDDLENVIEQLRAQVETEREGYRQVSERLVQVEAERDRLREELAALKAPDMLHVAEMDTEARRLVGLDPTEDR